MQKWVTQITRIKCFSSISNQERKPLQNSSFQPNFSLILDLIRLDCWKLCLIWFQFKERGKFKKMRRNKNKKRVNEISGKMVQTKKSYLRGITPILNVFFCPTFNFFFVFFLYPEIFKLLKSNLRKLTSVSILPEKSGNEIDRKNLESQKWLTLFRLKSTLL